VDFFTVVDEQTFLNDVEDQYRNFELLRPHLAQPITLEQNLYFHIEPSLVSALIERFVCGFRIIVELGTDHSVGYVDIMSLMTLLFATPLARG
jgi:hypothetical protein